MAIALLPEGKGYGMEGQLPFPDLVSDCGRLAGRVGVGRVAAGGSSPRFKIALTPVLIPRSVLERLGRGPC